MNNYIHYKVWDGITYPIPNFNGSQPKYCAYSLMIPVKKSRAPSQYEDGLFRYGYSHYKKNRRLWDRLTFTVGILILIRWRLYIETAPRTQQNRVNIFCNIRDVLWGLVVASSSKVYYRPTVHLWFSGDKVLVIWPLHEKHITLHDAVLNLLPTFAIINTYIERFVQHFAYMVHILGHFHMPF